jgi:hypothetical protein
MVRGALQVGLLRQKRNGYTVVVGEPERNRQLERNRLDGLKIK